jgi:hypothetical protein
MSNSILMNMPQGDSRNKIEYLARLIAEQYATMSDQYTLIQNLTINQGIATLEEHPAQPTAAMVYFNSTDKHFYGFNGESWQQLDNKELENTERHFWKIGGEYNSNLYAANGNFHLPTIEEGGAIEYEIIFKPEDLPYLSEKTDYRRQIMYGVHSDIEFRASLSLDGIPTKPSDYWIVFPSDRFDVFIDNEPVESRTEIGRIFDGKSHKIRYSIKLGVGEAPQIGAYFNGVIHSLKAYQPSGVQAWDMPMDEGEGVTFTCKLTGVVYKRNEGAFQPQGSSGRWVKG